MNKDCFVILSTKIELIKYQYQKYNIPQITRYLTTHRKTQHLQKDWQLIKVHFANNLRITIQTSGLSKSRNLLFTVDDFCYILV